MDELEGRRALVTGGSRGIGRAICIELARAGATIAVNYNASEEAAREVVAAIEAEGGSAFALGGDISDSGQATDLVKAAAAELGGLDILVNNAGITRDGLLMRMSEDDWDVVQQTNLRGVFAVTKASLRHLLRSSEGRVINITSVIGIMGNAGQVNYAASKAGLIGFTRSLAREVASRGVTVNAIALASSRPTSRRRSRRSSARTSAARSPSIASLAPRRSPRSCASSPDRAPRTSPASASTSMAAW